MNIGRRIRITGVVQGVGFRPWVHALASAYRVGGVVWNDPQGVSILVFGESRTLDTFVEAIRTSPPPLARIASITVETIPYEEHPHFRILPSQKKGRVEVAVTPDAATCRDCRQELLDPSNRRYRYPFINCTYCGPRYSIVTSVPYDRPNTTMVDFPMCEACRAEYEDPSDRRYHAQAICCPRCGPHLFFTHADGHRCEGDAIKLAAEALRTGGIVAIKGIGGFHLACDASREETVLRLRQRKRREEKPFAIMVRDTEVAATLIDLPPSAIPLLESPEHPILIAPRRVGIEDAIAPSVAPGHRTLGLMLPYTPIHLLLFAEGLTVLVMTSANLSDEPIVKDNEEAFERLRGIADFFLLHDRRIQTRLDDSVCRSGRERPVLLRRARGYVPLGIETGRIVDRILAFGGFLKNAPAIGRGSAIYPLQHIGDLETTLAIETFEETVKNFQAILEITPSLAACDLHPDYPTTHLAEASGLPWIRVQHHHAHLLSVMAEVRQYERAIGFAFDGTGYGDDGAIWGGEVLVFDPSSYDRVFHLAYLPLPGGDQAAKEPWRMALAYLHEAGIEELWERWLPSSLHPKAHDLLSLLHSHLPQPRTSSMGRLFDAVASLLGICHFNTYEGKAPMMLESLVRFDEEGTYPFTFAGSAIDVHEMIRAILRDREAGVDPSTIAARFHRTIVMIMLACAREIREKFSIRRVFLSGGVFANAVLSNWASESLQRQGFEVILPSLLPPNDGGIAVGQAIAAAASRAGVA